MTWWVSSFVVVPWWHSCKAIISWTIIFQTNSSGIGVLNIQKKNNSKISVCSCPQFDLFTKTHAMPNVRTLFVALDNRGKITALAVLHEDVYETVFPVNDSFQKLNDVGMFEILEDVDFSHQLFLFLGCHFTIVDFLPCQDLGWI